VSLRLLLDEDISPRVADGLRRRGIDAVSVYDVGRANRRVADADQLAFAAEGGRVLVTYNRADYQALDARWRLEAREHAGILWCSERSIPRRAFGDLVRALEAMVVQHETLAGICLPVARQTEPRTPNAPG
jgi:predicted nuclease of predicted toxin-antitoxin system